MITHLRLGCGHCQRMLQVPVDYLNKRVICNHCSHSFVARPDEKELPYAPLRFAIATMHPDEASALAGFAAQTTEAEDRLGAELRLDPPPTHRSAAALAAEPAAGRPGDRELRGEIDRLRAEVEALRARADDASRLEAELARATGETRRFEIDLARSTGEVARLEAELGKSTGEASCLEAYLAKLTGEASRLETELTAAHGERHHLRDTVSMLHADIATRTADTERLEARFLQETNALREVAGGEVRSLQAEFETLRGRVAALTGEHEQLVVERDQARTERDQLRSELDAARQQADAFRREQEQHQAETARLRGEMEQQRLHREHERQVQHEAFTALKRSLAERIQSRTAVRPHEANHAGPAPPAAAVAAPDAVAVRDTLPAAEPASAPEAPPPAPAVGDEASALPFAGDAPASTADDQFRALRSHLRCLHEAEQKEKTGQPLVSRLSRILRPDGSNS